MHITRHWFLLTICFSPLLATDDWPQWRGPNRDGFWEPKPLRTDFASCEPKQLWKAEVGKGFGGVTVAEGRVYLMDRETKPQEIERVRCFEVTSGKPVWQHTWNVKYGEMGGYATGPRASITIENGKAYALGATGHIACFDATNGKVVWQHDAVQDLQARVPQWGFAASPYILGENLLIHVGAERNGSVIALHKTTGNERWRGGADPAGYCTPELIEHNGVKQLIQWGPKHLQSLDPSNGRTLWSYPYEITYGVSIAQPLYRDGVLLVSGYWHGTKALTPTSPPKLLWENEKAICGLMSAPLYRNGNVYLLDKSNGLTCFDLKTGKIHWQDSGELTPKESNPQMSIVWLDHAQGLIAALNAHGELVYAKLKPDGAEVLARHQVSKKTWAHPAFTKDRLFVRSDSELIAWQLW